MGIAVPAAPRLCAAICTRDRPAQLARALHSLLAQTDAPDEVVVVDNAPASDGTRRLVQEHFPTVRYVREPVPGLDFARNRALAETECGVVAFLDDDAVADAEWAGELRRAFAADDMLGVCTGRVEALGLETHGQRLFEANGGFSRGLRPIVLPRDASQPLHGRRAPLVAWALSVGSGNSFAVRRDLALRLGGFDVALDLGAFLPGGGDHDLLWRTLGAGWCVRYEPAALAWHEHRAALDAAYDQIIGHQRAVVAMLFKAALARGAQRRAGTVVFLAWRLAKPGARLLRRAAGRDPLPSPVLLRMWAACWAGLAAYPAARREAARRVAAGRMAEPLGGLEVAR